MTYPTWQELAGSPREAFGESGPSVERWFMTTWANRITLANTLSTTQRSYPSALLGDCWIQQIDINPYSNDLIASGTIAAPSTTVAAYATANGEPAALLRVSYVPDFTNKTWPTDVPKPGTIRADTVLRLRIRGSGEFLTFPVKGAEWQAHADQSPGDITANGEIAPPPADLNGRIKRPIRDLSIQWDYVDDPPVDDLDALLGTVNDDTFLGSPAETLLFDSYDVDDSFKLSSSDPHSHRLTLNIRRRMVVDPDDNLTIYGWNHDYNEAEGGWDKLLMSDGFPRYRIVAWDNMFA